MIGRSGRFPEVRRVGVRGRVRPRFVVWGVGGAFYSRQDGGSPYGRSRWGLNVSCLTGRSQVSPLSTSPAADQRADGYSIRKSNQKI